MFLGNEKEPVHRVKLDRGAGKELIGRAGQGLDEAGLGGDIVKGDAEIDLGRDAGGVTHRIVGDAIYVTQAEGAELREGAGGKVDGRDPTSDEGIAKEGVTEDGAVADRIIGKAGIGKVTEILVINRDDRTEGVGAGVGAENSREKAAADVDRPDGVLRPWLRLTSSTR